MRNISISIPQQTKQVLKGSSAKQERDEGNLKRVRDVKHIEKRQRKYLRVRRKGMSPKNQRQFVKLINSYQLRALRDWQGFADALPEAESLSEAQLFILQAARQSQHLYPASVKKTLDKYEQILATLSDDVDPSSDSLQQLIAYDHYLEGLLSMLVLCRRYDKPSNKPPRDTDEHQEEADE